MFTRLGPEQLRSPTKNVETLVSIGKIVLSCLVRGFRVSSSAVSGLWSVSCTSFSFAVCS